MIDRLTLLPRYILAWLVVGQAEGARDALAKAVYGSLFLWIVERVNEAIDTREERQRQQGGKNASSRRMSSSRMASDLIHFLHWLSILSYVSILQPTTLLFVSGPQKPRQPRTSLVCWTSLALSHSRRTHLSNCASIMQMRRYSSSSTNSFSNLSRYS